MLPHFVPGPVVFPKGAPYLAPDGAITVVGYNDMRSMLEAIDRLFQASHPEFRFHLVPKGTKTAAPALCRGLSAFAPMGAEFTDGDLVSFRAVVGSDPVLFRVAHDSITPLALSSPQGIFVNRANPLDVLTTPGYSPRGRPGAIWGLGGSSG
jgi:phosphate transport system substrate-binding protein